MTSLFRQRRLSLSYRRSKDARIFVRPKLLAAFVHKADECTIGKLIVEAVILLSARSQSDGGKVLRAAAQAYGVDTDTVALKVKQEFAAKEKAKKATKPKPKPAAKAKRAA